MKKWNRQQPVTREPGSSAFLEYLAALERDVSVGGGTSLPGMRLTVSLSAPSSPVVNDVWVKSASTGPAGIAIAVGATAPSGPTVGQIWIDTN